MEILDVSLINKKTFPSFWSCRKKSKVLLIVF
jgi:hypothetical protein